MYVPGLSLVFGLLLLKFTTAAVDSDLGPSRLPADIFTAYLEAWARMRRMSAAFSLFVFISFADKEAALVASLILFHFSPHNNCF